MRDPIDLVKADRDFWRGLCNRFAEAITIGGDGDVAIDEQILDDAMIRYMNADQSHQDNQP